MGDTGRQLPQGVKALRLMQLPQQFLPFGVDPVAVCHVPGHGRGLHHRPG